MKINLLNLIDKRRILSFALLCLSLDSQTQSNRTPHIFNTEQITNIITHLPSYTKFGVSGIGFYDNGLYVSSNVGLLKFQNDSVLQLLSWYPKDDVVSGPWVDPVSNRLWAMHDGKFSLLCFNGQLWQSFKVPETKGGYSRGDALAGVRMYASQERFYLEGGGSYWQWNEGSHTWLEQPVPTGLGSRKTYIINGKEIKTGWEAHLTRIVPLGKMILCAMRVEQSPFQHRQDNNFTSDRLYYFGREWKEIPNQTGSNYLVESIVPDNDSVAYALTMNKRLLRVTLQGIDTISSPGACDAMHVTSTGKLTASFRNLGIYEYNGMSWTKKFSAPYVADKDDEIRVYLAEHNNRYVVAMTPYGEKGQSKIWLSIDSTLKEIKVQ